MACLLPPRSRHPFSFVATDPPNLSGSEVCAVVCVDPSSSCALLRKESPHQLDITEPRFCPKGRNVLRGSAAGVWRIASPPRCFCTWCSLQVQRLGATLALLGHLRGIDLLPFSFVCTACCTEINVAVVYKHCQVWSAVVSFLAFCTLTQYDIGEVAYN